MSFIVWLSVNISYDLDTFVGQQLTRYICKTDIYVNNVWKFATLEKFHIKHLAHLQVCNMIDLPCS